MKTLILLLTFCFLVPLEANVVHIIYFQPSDQPPPTAKQLNEVRSIVEKTQDFYQQQLIKQGYDAKTFQFVIHTVKGKHKLQTYTTTPLDLLLIDAEFPPELQEPFWLKNGIRVVFLAGAKNIGKGGRTLKICNNKSKRCAYTAYIPASKKRAILSLTAHEIGHVFGLLHNTVKSTPFRSYIMNPKFLVNDDDQHNLNNHLLTEAETRLLNSHPYFSVERPAWYSIPSPEYKTLKMWGMLKINNR